MRDAAVPCAPMDLSSLPPPRGGRRLVMPTHEDNWLIYEVPP